MRVRSGSASVLDVCLCAAVVLLVAFVMFPMLSGCSSRTPSVGPAGTQPSRAEIEAERAETCMSNMQQIGKAMRQYMADWDDMYPTNRTLSPRGAQGPIEEHVVLSREGVDSNGNPLRFEHGVNWVEGLYGHVEAISGGSGSSVWRCPSVGKKAVSKSARVSYVMNANLVEQSEGIIRNASSLFVLREMDRLVDADLRPCNISVGKSDVVPQSPFLTNRDARIGNTDPKLHRNGSNVVFADGHVKYFDVSYFPSDGQIARSGWDAQTQQWYNIANSPTTAANLIRSIAITP